MKKLFFILFSLVSVSAFGQTYGNHNAARFTTLDGIIVANGTSNATAITDGSTGEVLTTDGAGGYTFETIPTQVTFGTDNQIPFTNSGGTGFDYDANFTWNGSIFSVTGEAIVDNVNLNGSTISATGATDLSLFLSSAGTGSVFINSTAYFTNGGQLRIRNTTNQISLGAEDPAFRTIISAVAPAATRTYTIPDFGSNDTFVGLAATQALTNKTYNGLTISGSAGTLTIPTSSSLIRAGGHSLTLTTTGTTDITFPTSGTLATQSFVSTSYVPYTGATSALNLGSQTLTTTGSITGGAGSFTTISGTTGTFVSSTGTGISTDVVNTGTAITNTAGVIIRNVNATTNNWAGVLFGNGTSNAALMGVQMVDRTNHYGDIAFATRAADGFLERFRISSTGTVNIATGALQLAGTTRISSAGAFTGTTATFSGQTLIGISSARSNYGGSVNPNLQVEGIDLNSSSIGLFRNGNVSSGGAFIFGRSRSASVGGVTALTNNDQIGRILNYGADGTSSALSSEIRSTVNGTVSTGIVPGQLEFITANSSGVLTEAMRINSTQNIGIGTSDLDGTPAIGRLTVKGSTADGSTNIIVGRDSGEANVFSVDTDGDIYTASGTLTDGTYTNTLPTSSGTLLNTTDLTAASGFTYQKIEVTVPSADVLQLGSTPYTLIPAPGAGKYIIVDRVVASIDYNSATYASGGSLVVRYTTATTQILSFGSFLNDASTDRIITSSSSTIQGNQINDAVSLTTTPTNPTTGNSDLIVTILYWIGEI